MKQFEFDPFRAEHRLRQDRGFFTAALEGIGQSLALYLPDPVAFGEEHGRAIGLDDGGKPLVVGHILRAELAHNAAPVPSQVERANPQCNDQGTVRNRAPMQVSRSAEPCEVPSVRSRIPKQEVPMARQFDVVVERDSEGTFVATVPALPGCHTQAKSLDELMERVREAIELCLEEQGEPPQDLDFVGVQRVTVEA